MSDNQRRKELRQRFKKLFKLGKEGAKVKGSSFDTSYIKSLAKNDKGLEEIKKIYSEVTTPLTKKMMTYLQGKTLEEALNFGIRNQNELVETLENFVKTKTDESRDIFLTVGLGFSPEEVDKFEFSFKEEMKPTTDIKDLTGLKMGASNFKDYSKKIFQMKKKLREEGKDPTDLLMMSEALFITGEPSTSEDVKILEKLKKPTTEATAIPEAQKEIMKGVERMKVRLLDKVQEKGEPELRMEAIKKISKSLIDTALEQAVKGIEKNEKMKLNEVQKEVIREQIEMEMEDKISKSSEEAKKREESPEKMTTAKEDIEKEKEAQARAKEMRSQSKPKEMTEEEVDEILGTATEQEQQETPQQRSNENVKMEMKKPDMRTEIDDLQPLPSKSDFIPPMRLGTSGKDIKELLDDIMYFMKNFKGQLKRESAIFKEVDKTNIEQLRKLHNKIVGKLAPKQKKEEGKKVGIIVNADEYIREQMKKILQEQTFSSLRPQDVVIDVGSRAAEGRDTKDFGDFAVKRTIDGGLASTREAVFRYMPSENDQDVGEEGKTEKQRKKPNRISMPKSRLNNERTNAIRMNVRNPFRVPQKTMKLKYLY